MVSQKHVPELGPKLPASQAVFLLINLYQQQLLRGCGNPDCNTPTCYTYCNAKQDKQPFRKLSLASARATAFYLTDSANPEAELCPHILENVLDRYPYNPDSAPPCPPGLNYPTQRWLRLWTLSENLLLLKEDAIRQDPNSFSQLLFNTRTVDTFLCYAGHTALKRLTTSGKPHQWIFEAEEQLVTGFDRFRANHNTEAAVNGVVHAISALSKVYVSSMNPGQDIGSKWAPKDPLALRLASKVAGIIASLRRESSYGIFTEAGLKSKLRNSQPISPEDHLLLQILARLTFDAADNQLFSDLALWMWPVITTNWDHSTIISVDNPVAAALSVLDILMKFDAISSPAISARLLEIRDPMKAAYQWRDWAKAGGYPYHISLLQYPWAIARHSQVRCFRALCFYRMSDAIDESRLNVRLLYNSISSLIHDGRPPPQGQSLQSGRLQMAMSKYLTLQVYRDSILSDALDELWRRQRRELFRPLRVKMLNAGEVGVDQGGLAQEFFRLVFIEAFNPAYGIFTVDERTRMAWFDPKSLEPLYKYEMLGLIMALAIFNGFTLPVTFPVTLYRKLCGEPVNSLEHIEQGWPDLAAGLEQLQTWDEGDVSDVYMRSYTFTFEAFGSMIHVDMAKTAAEADWSPIVAMASSQSSEDNAPLVTNATRSQYITDYICWLTDKSIRKQYEAFEKGFHTVLDVGMLTTIVPGVLQEIAEGRQFINTKALAKVARYDAGYSRHKPYIKEFWALVHSFNDDRKRKLLEFVTASDRIPVTGIQSVDFIVQRHGGDTESLPTSVTCFGRLLLPEYASKEKLARKLELALENSRGFGLS